MNIPNKLTIVRLLIVPFIILSLYMQRVEGAYVAFVLLLVAWITDILDGYIAKKRKLSTKFGAFFDPFVDKILVGFTFLVLSDLGIIPMWLVILMLFRDYFTQGIRSMVGAEGITIKSEWSGKIKFGLQMATIIFATFLLALSYSFPNIKENMLIAVFWVMVVATVEAYYALFEFLYKNRKMIKEWF